MKWNGLAWTCADDTVGGSGGGGTVTSVAANNGLQSAPNPITGAGVIGIAPAFQLPQNCSNGQVAKSSGPGGAWSCGNDLDTNASLTQGSGIVLTPNPITTAGTIAADTAFLQRRVTGTCPAGSSIRTINADGTVVCEADDAGTLGNAFVQGGNAFGATAILGTTDAQSLDVRVGGERVVRFQLNLGDIPSIVGGDPANQATGGAAFVGGGGGGGTNCFDPVAVSNNAPCRNLAAQPWSVVAGGYANVAGLQAVVGGGSGNNANTAAVVGGGFGNLAGTQAVVSGGVRNRASGQGSAVGGGANNLASSTRAVVAGGDANEASGLLAAVGGGTSNRASGSAAAILGGGLICRDPPDCTGFSVVGNVAAGRNAVVPGGAGNRAGGDNSLAAGRFAVVRSAAESGDFDGDEGSFVWSDTLEFDFVSAGPNEFAARASGGVRFVTKIDRNGLPTETFAIVPGDVGNGQRVGISTATPEAPLHVVEGQAGVSANSESSIVAERNTSNFVSILAPTTVEAGVLFGSPANAQDGGVVYDHSDRSLAFRTNGNMNRMRIFANGGVGIARTSASHPVHVGTSVLNGNGAHLTASGVWTNGSSRSFKEGFEAIDARDVLERVAAMPISAWRYTGDTARHIGPTAEDFKAAFGLGGDERYIGTVDADGVALAAIQGLNAKLEARLGEKQAAIAARDAEIAQLKAGLVELRRAVELLNARVGGDDRVAAR
jgi:hypothetical protein